VSDLLELDIFADRLVGFRLQRFEVLNWGTFDGSVWTLHLDGRNSLLTGDIGSGKSTLVDGLTTLLVEPRRISYNKAAGAEHRERTLGSYVRGHYKSERAESGARARPVALRDTSKHTVLLAVFGNEALGQTVTLAQVFAFKDDSGTPVKLYVVADGALSIAADFTGFGPDLTALRRRLRAAGALVHDHHAGYAAEFRRRFGIKHPQAMELFHQTVSMKSVGNLTDFVRSHMLEPSDVAGRIADLVSHYEDLSTAHDRVLDTKRQVDALTPLTRDLDEHDAAAARARDHRALRDALRPWFAGRRAALLAVRIAKLSEEADRLAARRSTAEADLAAGQREEIDLRTAIANNGGDRITHLEQQLADAAARRDTKRRNADHYARLCAALDLQPAADEAGLQAQRASLQELREQLDDDLAVVDGQRQESAVAQHGLRTELGEAESELAGLSRRDSNIDERMVVIREQLCRDTGLRAEDVPFAGELVQVTDPAWEPAAERLLRSFGLSLLVPERHHSTVAAWVDRTDLRGRLVYFRVRGARNAPAVTDSRSLVHRLEVKPGTPFTDWVAAEIARRFDLVCARTMEEFAQATHAITARGLIKTGGDRHEKDDRHAIDDRRRYVLGWNNAAKRAALTAEVARLRAAQQREAARSTSLQARAKDLQTRAEHVAALARIEDYAALDWRTEVVLIEGLGAELERLRTSSDVLVELDRRLAQVRTANEQLSGRLAGLNERIGSTRSRIDQATADEQAARGESVPFEQPMASILAQCEADEIGPGLTIENCARVEQDIRGRLTKEIDNDDHRMRRKADSIVRAMTEFRREWPLLGQDFDASVDAGHEYRALLQRLVDDDLPRFQGKFKQLLNEEAIKAIVGFSGHLQTEVEKIRERVGIINDSLRGIDYQPETYIKLEYRGTDDADIREFRNELRACTEDTVSGAGDDQYSEAKFLQVKAIISRFKGRDGRTEDDRRWTARVTDVRTWFTFAASERLRADDSEYEHYSDSGGKSGGQKEKLAYTILAASLAYQFGLVTGETHSRTFRFVVIDEAFGRGSDESARFGLELFRTLQLQLLVVTPLQKIHIIEPYVSGVGFVHNEGGSTSKLRNLTIEEYRQAKAR
jgi:uncharacterized protein YPO0396